MPRPWQTLSKPWVTVAVAPSPDSTHHPELVWVEMQAHCHAVLCRGNAGSGHTTEWPGPPVCHPVITHPGVPCPQPGPRCPGPLRPQWAAHTGCLLQSPGLLFSSASGPSPTPDQLDESHANEGDIRDAGLICGLERCPREGHGYFLQCSCLENPMDRGAWWVTVHGVAKSWT